MVWQIIAIKKPKSGQYPYFSDHLISGIRPPQVQIPLRYKQSLHWCCQAIALRLSLVPVGGFPRPGNDAIQPLEKSASKLLICNERNFGACGLRVFDGGCDRLSTEIPNGGYPWYLCNGLRTGQRLGSSLPVGSAKWQRSVPSRSKVI
jgi:hypothetical protein